MASPALPWWVRVCACMCLCMRDHGYTYSVGKHKGMVCEHILHPSPGMCGCVTLSVMNRLHWYSLENHGHCSFPVLPLER